MSSDRAETEGYFTELRLFLESVCCDLCRFQHVVVDGVPPREVRIHQEVPVGERAFADIRVTVPGAPSYFVEVDYGYSAERILESLRRKYGHDTPVSAEASKVVLVADTSRHRSWKTVEAEARGALRPGLPLEVWDEAHLRTLVRERFEVTLDSFDDSALLDLRLAIDRAKGRYAFGDAYTGDPLQATLLWHFGFWQLRQLTQAGRGTPRAILPPGLYPGVIAIMADLASFSSYVRDTRDDEVIRQSLTSFSSKARYQIINDGGMVYQFLGDAVIAFFGLPERSDEDASRALECATALVDVGASVANEWQRQIDQVQTSAGVHVAITGGDLQILSLRPFSRTHMGAIADSINLAARLNSVAAAGEIVVSNVFYQRLPSNRRTQFQELEPVEARNIGRVRAWKRAADSQRSR